MACVASVSISHRREADRSQALQSISHSDLPDNSYRGQHVKIPIIGLGVSFLPAQSPPEILK